MMNEVIASLNAIQAPARPPEAAKGAVRDSQPTVGVQAPASAGIPFVRHGAAQE